jgi:hypothetical protein
MGGLKRVGPKLTVCEQIQLGEKRSKTNHPFRGRWLAIYITSPSGRPTKSRAEDLFIDRGNGQVVFNCAAPALSAAGVKVYFRTRKGLNMEDLRALDGMTPEQIDHKMDELDREFAQKIREDSERLLAEKLFEQDAFSRLIESLKNSGVFDDGWDPY